MSLIQRVQRDLRQLLLEKHQWQVERQQWQVERRQWQDAVDACCREIDFLNRKVREADSELRRTRENARQELLEAQTARDTIGRIAMKELKRAGGCMQYLLEFELDAYKTTSGDLKAAQQEVQRFIEEYKSDMQRLETERARTAEERLRTAEANLRMAEEKLRTAEDKVRARELYGDLCQQLRTAQSDCAAWSEELFAASHDCAQQTKSLQNQLSSAKGQLRKLQTELKKSLQDQEDGFKKSLESKDTEIARLREALKTCEQNFKAAAEFRDKEKRGRESDCVFFRGLVDAAESLANAQIKECRKLEEECMRLREKVQQLEKKIENWQPVIKLTNDRHKAKVAKLEAEIERLQAALPDKESA
jgi:chromosome segregation ATPase